MYTSMPADCRCAIASLALGFSVSRSSSGMSDGRVKSMFGFGMVSVPVLSTTIARILCRFSSADASFIRICFCAALPMPTMSAVGVANPIAQGQAMTSTATAERIACGSAALPPTAHHMQNVSRAMAATVGTNTRAARSTMRCTGALLPCASCTMRMMCARAVFSPI